VKGSEFVPTLAESIGFGARLRAAATVGSAWVQRVNDVCGTNQYVAREKRENVAVG